MRCYRLKSHLAGRSHIRTSKNFIGLGDCNISACPPWLVIYAVDFLTEFSKRFKTGQGDWDFGVSVVLNNAKASIVQGEKLCNFSGHVEHRQPVLICNSF